MVNEIKFVPTASKVGEVRYVENKEQQLANQQQAEQSRIAMNYQAEWEAWDAVPGYGPTLSGEDKAQAAVAGTGLGVVTGILTAICPPAGTLVAAVEGAIAVGAAVTKECSKKEDTKDAAQAISTVYGISSAIGGISSEVVGAANASHLNCLHK